MKEYIAGLVRGASTPLEARNIVREYLQARILGAMQRAGAMIPLSFHGGTALRFLYATGRYSEDLDFALEKNRDDYDFHKYLESIRSELTAEGYNVGFKVSDKKIVHGAFVNLRGLLSRIKSADSISTDWLISPVTPARRNIKGSARAVLLPLWRRHVCRHAGGRPDSAS